GRVLDRAEKPGLEPIDVGFFGSRLQEDLAPWRPASLHLPVLSQGKSRQALLSANIGVNGMVPRRAIDNRSVEVDDNRVKHRTCRPRISPRRGPGNPRPACRIPRSFLQTSDLR